MKTGNKVVHGSESRELILQGINLLANVVGSTLGAKGRNVLLEQDYGSPMIINDGVTIARNIQFKNKLMNAGAQIIKDAARRTNDLAGDGTTGSTVLSRAIVEQGWELVHKQEKNPVELRRELQEACGKVEEQLRKSAVKLEEKEQAQQIASVSVQDKVLGSEIGALMHELGPNGAVSIKDNPLKRGVSFEKESGMRIEGALKGGVIENDDKWSTTLDNPHVLVLEDSPEDNEFENKWVPLLKQFTEGQMLPDGKIQIDKVHVPTFLVIAEKLSRRFAMAMNRNKDVVKWVWFRPSTAEKNMKEVYKDLRSMLGGKVVNEEDGVFLAKIELSDLGRAETAMATRHELVLTVSAKQLAENEFLDRIKAVEGQVENAEDETEKAQIQDRLANLTGGVASIKVSAATEQDTMELKLRIEDAINATRSAMEEGYLPGGGVALLNAASVLEGKTDGERVLQRACSANIRQILDNAGYDDVDKIIKDLNGSIGVGINVLTDEEVNMTEEGIIDPLKVIRLSLIHAVSVSGLLLTSEFVVVDEEDEVETVKEFFKK